MRRLCPECNELIDENGACSAGCPNNEFDEEAQDEADNYCDICGAYLDPESLEVHDCEEEEEE